MRRTARRRSGGADRDVGAGPRTRIAGEQKEQRQAERAQDETYSGAEHARDKGPGQDERDVEHGLPRC